MGGNALKNVKTRRYGHQEYFDAADKILLELRKQDVVCDLIPSYDEKETFGDLDIIYCFDSDIKGLITKTFSPKEIVVNGPVLSFDYHSLQVDLIKSNEKEYEFSYYYFSYNDLGNLLGRIAHKLGLKLGHDCLKYVVREESNVIGEIAITYDWNQALSLLRYDASRYFEGFSTLEDIFDYVASGKFFDPDIYLLNNRNAQSRVRDKKRENYTKFLEYCSAKSLQATPNIPTKDAFLKYLLCDLDFKKRYDKIVFANNRKKVLRAKFNGDIVGQLTGFSGKKLGAYMEYIKSNFSLDNLSSEEIKTLCLDNISEFKYSDQEQKTTSKPDVVSSSDSIQLNTKLEEKVEIEPIKNDCKNEDKLTVVKPEEA